MAGMAITNGTFFPACPIYMSQFQLQPKSLKHAVQNSLTFRVKKKDKLNRTGWAMLFTEGVFHMIGPFFLDLLLIVVIGGYGLN